MHDKKTKFTSLRLWESTKKRLDKAKIKDTESYNDVINRVLDDYENIQENEDKIIFHWDTPQDSNLTDEDKYKINLNISNSTKFLLKGISSEIQKQIDVIVKSTVENYIKNKNQKKE